MPNNLPVLTPSASQPNYVDRAAGATYYTLIDPAIVLSDVDSSTFASAKVTISSGLASTDRLDLFYSGDIGNIYVTYSSLSGQLSLTSGDASATLEQWQNALRNVCYRSTVREPISATTKLISISINDGTNDSLSVSKTLNVQALNDPVRLKLGFERAEFGLMRNEIPKEISILNNGQYVVTGGVSDKFTSSSGGTFQQAGFAIARFNGDGTFDKSFGDQGLTSTSFVNGADGTVIWEIEPLPEGKFLALGYKVDSASNRQTEWAVARYNADGTLDTSFDSDGKKTFSYSNYSSLYVATVLPNGKILLAGDNVSSDDSGVSLVSQATLTTLNPDGTLDETFGDSGFVTVPLLLEENISFPVGAADYVEGADAGIFGLVDGKILVVSSFYWGFQEGVTITRLNANGTLDTTFENDGRVVNVLDTDVSKFFNLVISSGVLLGDGKVVCIGRSGDTGFYSSPNYFLLKFDTNGRLDSTFGTGGKVVVGNDVSLQKVLIQPDGKLVVIGSQELDFLLRRYNVDGSLDTSFGTGGSVTGTAGLGSGATGAIDNAGKLIVASSGFAIARFNSDGSLDSSFGAVAQLPAQGSVVLDNHALISDAEMSVTGYAGASLTLARQGGANTHDAFLAASGGTLGALTEGANLTVGGTSVGTVQVNHGGTLTLSFGPGATEALVNSAMTQIAYSNTGDTPGSRIEIAWVFNDGNSGAQGPGGAQVTTAKSVVHLAPTVAASPLAVTEDVPQVGQVSAIGANPYSLAFQVTTAPSHGILNLNSSTGKYTYVPEANYNGPDTFSVKVNDGAVDSAAAAVSISVSAVNDLPTGDVWVAGTPKVGEVLEAGNSLADVDGLGTVSYQWLLDNTPITGATSSKLPVIADYVGKQLAVRASQTDLGGTAEAFTSTKTLAVVVGGSTAVTVAEDLVLADASRRLVQPDAATPEIGFSNAVFNPASGSNPASVTFDVVYKGAAGQSNLSLDFSVISKVTAVTFSGANSNIQGAGDPQSGVVAIIGSQPFGVNTTLGQLKFDLISGATGFAIDLSASPYSKIGAATLITNLPAPIVAGLDEYQYSIGQQGSHGTAAISGGNYTYTPAANYNGTDSFNLQYTVGSQVFTKTVNVTVTPVNDAPVATPISVVTLEDTAAAGFLSGTDVDNTARTYIQVQGPAHGTVTIDQLTGAYTYTPTGNYNGSDSFTFKVNDGSLDSTAATVAITVTAVNDVPTGTVAITGQGHFGSTLTVTNTLADPDVMGLLNYQWRANGEAIQGANGNTLNVGNLLLGKTMSVLASYTDGGGTLESLSSNTITIDPGATLTVTPYQWATHSILPGAVVTTSGVIASTNVQGAYVMNEIGLGATPLSVVERSTPAADRAAVTLKDALATLKLAIGVTGINGNSASGSPNPVSPYQLAAADFNGDGKVDLKDALEILKYSIGVATSSSPKWQFYDETQIISSGKTPVNDFGGSTGMITLSGDKSLGLAAVLTGDVDGSWAPPSGSTIVDSQHFTALVTSLQAADPDVSLARWGIYG